MLNTEVNLQISAVLLLLILALLTEQVFWASFVLHQFMYSMGITGAIF